MALTFRWTSGRAFSTDVACVHEMKDGPSYRTRSYDAAGREGRITTGIRLLLPGAAGRDDRITTGMCIFLAGAAGRIGRPWWRGLSWSVCWRVADALHGRARVRV